MPTAITRRFTGCSSAKRESAIVRGVVHRWIQRTWYEGGKSYVALLPLAGLYWLTGSLWASMLLHATADVTSGLMARESFADG